MFSTSFVAATLALSALSASARIFPRHRLIAKDVVTPSTYDTTYLEPYLNYHARYLALGCEYNHGNDFFAACCHPMLINETLADLEPRCTPDSGVLSSVSASLEGTTSSSVAASSSAPAASSSAPAASSSAPAATTAAPAENLAAPSSSSSWTPTSSSSTWSSSSSSWVASVTSAAASTAQTMTGGFGTFFYQNGVAGACGATNPDTAVIVAMDSAIYNHGLCGKQVIITNTANGKSVTATVADECPTCINANSIDMSVGAFTQIGDETTGQLDISWVWA